MQKTISKTTLAGLLYAIIIIMVLLKNITSFISVPVINTVLILATIYIGAVWGIGFCIMVPVTSLIFAPASAMTAISGATNGLILPIIIIGNILLALSAYFGFKKGNKQFIVMLIVGALLKWLFMWGCADFIVKPLFTYNLGKLLAAFNKMFSIFQLYAGLLSIILILPVVKAADKIKSAK